MSGKDLKPCPFCGGEAEVYESEAFNLITEEKEKTGVKYFVMCRKCTALTCGATEKKAVEQWNRRAKDERFNKYRN